jgi:hypothetical protein
VGPSVRPLPQQRSIATGAILTGLSVFLSGRRIADVTRPPPTARERQIPRPGTTSSPGGHPGTGKRRARAAMYQSSASSRVMKE